MTFFHLDAFKLIIYFCSLICVFVLLFDYVFVLLALFGVFGAFRAFFACKTLSWKNKKSKTDLMTSFILLLWIDSIYIVLKSISVWTKHIWKHMKKDMEEKTKFSKILPNNQIITAFRIELRVQEMTMN